MNTTNTYRTLLKLIKPITARNNNTVWESYLKSQYAVLDSPSSSLDLKTRQSDAEALVSYMSACQTHKEMIERYWPTSDMSGEEKLRQTANTVGFSLPTKYTDEQLGLKKVLDGLSNKESS
jgi:Complex1_LYR-like